MKKVCVDDKSVLRLFFGLSKKANIIVSRQAGNHISHVMDSFILNQSIWQVDPLLVLIVEIQFPLIGFGRLSLSYLQKYSKLWFILYYFYQLRETNNRLMWIRISHRTQHNKLRLVAKYRFKCLYQARKYVISPIQMWKAAVSFFPHMINLTNWLLTQW